MQERLLFRCRGGHIHIYSWAGPGGRLTHWVAPLPQPGSQRWPEARSSRLSTPALALHPHRWESSEPQSLYVDHYVCGWTTCLLHFFRFFSDPGFGKNIKVPRNARYEFSMERQISKGTEIFRLQLQILSANRRRPSQGLQAGEERGCEWSEVKSLSRVRLFATPWIVAYQAPPSMGFSRLEYWSGLPFPSPGLSSWPRGRTRVSRIGGRRFNLWATREAPSYKLKSSAC